MAGHLSVLAIILAAASSSLLVSGTSFCVNDSTFSPGTGGGDEGDGDYAPVLLVGRYRMRVDSANQQYEKLEALAQEQLLLQREILDKYKDSSEVPYLDCEDAYERGVRSSGVYTIQPDDDAPFQVYCDMETDSGGWTVFQRRKDGSVDFYYHRDWMDYARGFGNLTGEFWLGLRKLHRISAVSSGSDGNELRVELEDFEGNTAYAKYRRFFVENSANKYRLDVSRYTGTAGDSLSYQNRQKFTTKDQDNDANSSDNCAIRHPGAWWFSSCHRSNLNAPYVHSGHTTRVWGGVYWHQWKGHYSSLKGTEMKLRRQ